MVAILYILHSTSVVFLRSSHKKMHKPQPQFNIILYICTKLYWYRWPQSHLYQFLKIA